MSGYSDAIVKFIESVTLGIGKLYKPTGIRKEADAEAYRIKTIGKATTETEIESLELKLDASERIRSRITIVENQRDQNLLAVVNGSPKFLPDKASINPIDPDWRTRFFNKAQDVSTKELQEIWSRILAEEVANPGAISLRTLDLLSNLTKDEAEMFQRICEITFDCKHIWKGIVPRSGTGLDGITSTDLLRLEAAGLIHSVAITHNYLSPGSAGITLLYAKSVEVVYQDYYSFEIYHLSHSGSELCAILEVKPNLSFLNSVIDEMRSESYNVDILKNVNKRSN